MDAGPLAVGAGAAAAGAAGVAAADRRGGSDRDHGARYNSGDGTTYDRPGGDTVVGRAPAGGRLIYDQVARDGNGNITDYHVRSGTGTPGWIPARNTTETRPTAPPPPHIILPLDSSLDADRSHAAHANAGRG